MPHLMSETASTTTNAPHTQNNRQNTNKQAVAAFVDWLCGQLRRPANPTRSVPCAAAALAALLRARSARALLTRAGGVQLLVPLLRSCGSPAASQLLYEVCLCLWQLSYHPPAAEAMAAAGARSRFACVCVFVCASPLACGRLPVCLCEGGQGLRTRSPARGRRYQKTT